MGGLTPAQFAALGSGKPAASVTAPAKGGMTPAQFAALNNPFNPKAQNSQFVQPGSPEPGTSIGSQGGVFGNLGTGIKQTAAALVAPIKGGAKEVATDTKAAFNSGVQQVKQGASDINSKNTNGNPLDLIRGVGRIGSGIIGSAFSPLAAPMKPISSAAQYTADKISNSPTVQKFANTTFGKNVAGAAENVANYSTIAQVAGGVESAPEVAAKGEAGLNTMAEAAKPGIEAVKNDVASITNKVGEVKDNIKGNLQDHYINQAADQWAKPATTPGAKFSKATDIYNAAADKGHDIGQTLVKNNLNPAEHIEKGVYTTADSAEKLRTDTSKLSTEMLRPSLEKADLTVPKTPVSDVIKSSLDNLKNNKSLTQETRDLLTKKINQTAAALQKQFPDGMSLTDMHDEKIVRDLNSKYSPVGDIGTNNEAIKNKAIGDALRKTVETKAPEDVPVHEFNQELAKQYKAADYLDALNNKKAPVTTMGKLRNYMGKMAGLAVGHGVGGGILADVAGYHIGGMIENMLEGMSNPVKNHFLENLKTSNPEAFTKIQEFLNKPNEPTAEPSVTTKQTIQPTNLAETGQYNVTRNAKTNAIELTPKAPSNIGKINNYMSDFPKYFTKDQIDSATKMLEQMKQSGKTIDMKAVNQVVKRVTAVEDIKPIPKQMANAQDAARINRISKIPVKRGAFSPK